MRFDVPAHGLLSLLRAAACAAGLAAFAPAPAAAAPLALPTSRVQCDIRAPGVFEQQITGSTCTLGAGGPLSSFADVGTVPFITLVGEVSAPGFVVNAVSASFTGFLSYQFQVTGGHAGDIVPVSFSTQMETIGGDGVHSRGFADLLVQDASGGTLIDFATCTPGSGCSGPIDFKGTFVTPLRVGDIGTVTLSISAFAGSSQFDQFASVSADPYIFIDPSFAGADQYAIEVSPGIANAPGELPPTAGVPEPASAALVTLALGAAGFARRRA